MPSVFAGASFGSALIAFGVWNIANSIRLWPSGVRSIAMSRRLIDALDDLETVAPPERQSALRLQRDLLLTAVGETVGDKRDAAFAVVADRQGIGVTAGTHFEDRL